jgi:hypothetical protein
MLSLFSTTKASHLTCQLALDRPSKMFLVIRLVFAKGFEFEAKN